MTYPVTALPPLSIGGAQETVALALPPVAITTVGTAGAVGLGVTEFDADDCAPVPALVIAATWNVYVTPLVRPVNV